MKSVKIGTLAVSSLLIVAFAGSTAPTFANANGSNAATTISVSRDSERTALTQETATVDYVQGSEWSLNSDSSAVTVKYEMTDEQNSARESLISAYNNAQSTYGSNGSASSSTLEALSNAMNTASEHLADTSTSVDTYNADISALQDAASKVKSSAAAATAAASTSSSTSSSSSSSSSTVTVSGSGSGSELASYAVGFVGSPYLWGGSTPSGWDCSGFLQYVYAQFGVSLPRTSGAQATVGTAVASLSEAQPGDIIANGIHAAIYIGNGKVVNALAPGLGTQVTSLASFGGNSYSIRRVLS
ncbi:C40 family peptidase [Alloscardovia criceti]|uniref:C40 family peptidase n=1 Tax=Alloscardovia criceti TaxID=356828 RepID=UPI001FDFD712|nr:C40 family peptidase [Alloscardovia criceti]